MNTVFALSGVVIKELYRRKDFYVLFVLTALITVVVGSVRFFDDGKIIRIVKEASLLLIWISALVIAVPVDDGLRGEPGQLSEMDDKPSTWICQPFAVDRG